MIMVEVMVEVTVGRIVGLKRGAPGEVWTGADVEGAL